MLNIPDSPYNRIVIVGAGFAGINLAKKLAKKEYQVVLIDKYNFHQFQPLFYQVAMAGLEPTSIVYPLRKLFQKNKNIHIRITEVESIKPDKKRLSTSLGEIYYDELVIATGATTNFFGNKDFKQLTYGMKTLSESLKLRNAILLDLEKALITPDYQDRQGLIDIVIVGGGPTGVELAGALAEMKTYILPKDYPELDEKEVDIHLFQGGDRLLMGMSEASSAKALKFLEKLNVKVHLKKRVESYDGTCAHTQCGMSIPATKVIWAAGITGNVIAGLPDDLIRRGRRIAVDSLNKVKNHTHIYAIGDIACMESEALPRGHPQVAQVAIQQAKNLAHNLIKNQERPFNYKDYGSMATIGRNKAVAEIGNFKFSGIFAWFVWLFVHVSSLIGFRNRIVVILNWIWNYFTYDQSLRVIIQQEVKKAEV